jgi:hypothetical protein
VAEDAVEELRSARARTAIDAAYHKAEGNSDLETGAESVLTPRRPTGHLPAETAVRSTITQIYEGTNQIQRVVMARQLLK